MRGEGGPEEVFYGEPGYADCLYEGQLGVLGLQIWDCGQHHPDLGVIALKGREGKARDVPSR